MSSGSRNDPHSERESECPKNSFGCTDYRELEILEKPFAFKRARELEARGLAGIFDLEHIKAIHKYLFQDVFPWAGEFRVVNISKGSAMFCPATRIVSALDDALSKLHTSPCRPGIRFPGPDLLRRRW